MNCCEATSNSGNWWVDPDNDTVSDNLSPSLSLNAYYQEYRKNSVLLQRQEMASTLEGIFRCDIVDTNDQTQHLYVGIYSQSGNSKR